MRLEGLCQLLIYSSKKNSGKAKCVVLFDKPIYGGRAEMVCHFL